MTTNTHEAGYHEWTMGDRLRAAREAVTSDRKHFAQMIGISRDTVRNYERGTYKPKPPMLAAWCLATGFDKVWILTGQLPDRPNGEGEVPTTVPLREACGNRSRNVPIILLKLAA